MQKADLLSQTTLQLWTPDTWHGVFFFSRQHGQFGVLPQVRRIAGPWIPFDGALKSQPDKMTQGHGKPRKIGWHLSVLLVNSHNICRNRLTVTIDHKPSTQLHTVLSWAIRRPYYGWNKWYLDYYCATTPPCSEANLQEGEAANYGYAQ